MTKEYAVRLTDEERKLCEFTIDRLKGSSLNACRAWVRLQVEADWPGWTERQVAEVFRCRVQTAENVRGRCVMEGFDLGLCGKQRSCPLVPKPRASEQAAGVVALLPSSPSAGYRNWSLRLLARHVVKLGTVASISHETVLHTLRKTLSRGARCSSG